jgi:hypothetical protein
MAAGSEYKVLHLRHRGILRFNSLSQKNEKRTETKLNAFHFVRFLSKD